MRLSFTDFSLNFKNTYEKKFYEHEKRLLDLEEYLFKNLASSSTPK